MLKNWEISDRSIIKQGQGLVYQGTVTAVGSTTECTVASLAGFGNDYFCSASYDDWQIYVAWDAAGAGAAPQGLFSIVSDYVSATGTFTHATLTTLAVGDKILLVHPILAYIGTMVTTAADGAVTTSDYLSGYVKQILNELLGTDGGWTNMNNAAVASLDAALQVLASVLNMDGAQQFSVGFDAGTHTDLDALWTALGTLLGTRATAAAAGLVTSTDGVIAYLKQIVNRERTSQLTHVGAVASVSSNTFVVTDFIGYGDDYFVGWWVHVIWDASGGSAAPQDEWRLCTDFTTSTGTVTHNAFSAALVATDVIELVHPAVYEAIAMRGGAGTIQAIRDDQNAGLDFARVETIASPVTLTASIQYIYSNAPGKPFYFAGGFISQDSGAWATGETVDVNIQVKTDGTNWVDCWNMTQLAAAASPLEVAIPHEALTALLNLPKGFWNDGSGVRVGIVQTVEGNGFGVWSHKFVDGVPGN